MCSIFGYYSLDGNSDLLKLVINEEFFELQKQRGKDGFGFFQKNQLGRSSLFKTLHPESGDLPELITKPLIGLGHCRAEPTSETREEKSEADLQPFEYSGVWSVHNGTIYNDKEILGSTNETFLTKVDSYAIPVAYRRNMTEKLKGSQATAVWMDENLFLCRTYNPLYLYLVHGSFWLFSSLPLEEYLNSKQLYYRVYDIPTYCSLKINAKEGAVMWRNKAFENQDKAIVCCSGGLDATVSSQVACNQHNEVTLMYFDYGCRASEREWKAVQDLTKALKKDFPGKKIECLKEDFSFLKNLGGSTLTDTSKELGKGEAAAENCIDWVPARNTAFIGLLASYCDRYVFSKSS